jgi:hypothetical protein
MDNHEMTTDHYLDEGTIKDIQRYLAGGFLGWHQIADRVGVPLSVVDQVMMDTSFRYDPDEDCVYVDNEPF